LTNYEAAEPVFFSNIKIDGISRSAINQNMKILCEEKAEKSEQGVYYILK